MEDLQDSKRIGPEAAEQQASQENHLGLFGVGTLK